MKIKVLSIALFVMCVFQLQAAQQLRYTINESWQFIKDNNIANVDEFLSQLKRAERVDIPHTWNDKDVVDEEKGFYRGAGWYSKNVRIPSSYKNKQVFLFFEGVATAAEIYINKKLVRTHIGGFTRFVVPVTPYINFVPNTEFSTFNVVVKADNSHNEDWPALHADFTFFGGMYRDVNLVVTEKVHFNVEDYAANGVFITTPNVSAESGDVNLKLRIKNDEAATKKVKVLTKVYGPDQKLVAEKSKAFKLIAGVSNEFNLELDPVLNPQLWSPDAPNLYRVVCEIFDAKTGNKLDESINPLGFRWFRFDVEDGFFLNGKPLKLIGTNRHQDFDKIGNALPDHIHVEDIMRMKAMGSNFLRIAHYPQDPAILEMCDRLGIITTVETPIIDTVTESEAFTQNCMSAQKEMIRQNFNHPSLIIWAYMNEVLLQPRYKNNKERYEKYTKYIADLAQNLENLTRAEDPYRYTMIPNHAGLERYMEAGLCDIPMIVGWNIYDGWYGGGYQNLQSKLEKYHQMVRKPMIITEYGAGADPRLHTLTPTRFDFSQEYAVEFHNHYLNYFKKTPWIAGANVWNYADFNSEGRVDAVQSINNKGLVGINRTPKNVFYYYQAALLKKPFVAIAAKTWKQRSYLEDATGKGISTMKVDVFSNQEEIELFLNGKSLGTKKMDSVWIQWEVPFVDGINRLRAVNKTTDYCEDFAEVRVNVLPLSLKEKFPAGGLSVNLGDQRFFYDDQFDQAWMFDKEYAEGSWGSIGGKPYVRPVQNVQQPYGAKMPVNGTFKDPIYQTQLIGIEQFKLEVPAGKYEVTLHFSELEGATATHLPYDLAGEDKSIKGVTNRTFSVSINGQTVIEKLNLLAQYGEYQAVKIKSEVTVDDKGFIIVDFKKMVGEPVLNAIEVYKKL
ncbi:glycoside hydrolase family 2 TIM barrel-domain containing protein [Flavobacterium faecale]|uniref:glycoside hydrolase family 2 TIM barrel-domain containing protein n=1 Tax=Flavobacterium faecale TaxID=1355330 RepID=UPI003AAA87B5